MLSASYRSQFKKYAIALAASTSALATICGGPVSATEVINFKYNTLELSIPTDELVDFVRTGTLNPNAESFLQREVGTDFPSILQRILGTEIRVSPNFVKETLGGSLGEFVLLQIDQAINSGRIDADLAALRNTLQESVEEDGKISLIELIERYPLETVDINLTNLQTVYNRVSGFLENIEPALRTAKEFLQDIICDCENPTATDEMESSPESSLPNSGASLASFSDPTKHCKTLTTQLNNGTVNLENLVLSDSE